MELKCLQKNSAKLVFKVWKSINYWRFDEWSNWIFQIFFFCCLSCGVNIKMSLAAAASFTWWFTGLDCEGLKECLYLLKILEFFHCLFILKGSSRLMYVLLFVHDNQDLRSRFQVWDCNIFEIMIIMSPKMLLHSITRQYCSWFWWNSGNIWLYMF